MGQTRAAHGVQVWVRTLLPQYSSPRDTNCLRRLSRSRTFCLSLAGRANTMGIDAHAHVRPGLTPPAQRCPGPGAPDRWCSRTGSAVPKATPLSSSAARTCTGGGAALLVTSSASSPAHGRAEGIAALRRDVLPCWRWKARRTVPAKEHPLRQAPYAFKGMDRRGSLRPCLGRAAQLRRTAVCRPPAVSPHWTSSAGSHVGSRSRSVPVERIPAAATTGRLPWKGRAAPPS
eukprot:scaffold2280_cov430-Prasinococcus_capsulatus_cf.AAC.5